MSSDTEPGPVDLPMDALVPITAPGAPQPKSLDDLGKMLINTHVITQAQFDQSRSFQKEYGGRLGTILVAMGFLSEAQANNPLSRKMGLNASELDTLAPKQEIIDMVPEHAVRRHQAVPLRLSSGRLVVGMTDPFDDYAINELKFESGIQHIESCYITYETFKRFIDTRFTNEAFEDGTGFAVDPLKTEASNDEEMGEIVVGLVDRILKNAVQRRASDIHIEPYETFCRIRFRVDGALYNFLTPPNNLHTPLVSRIKVLSAMDIAEKRKAQDGQMSDVIGGEEIDFRVSTLPTVFGEKCVMRLFRKDENLGDLEQLGLEPDQLKLLKQVAQLPQGLMLVTGPTGSGKTTSLHATLNFINDPDVNIVTIEDPVESTIPGVNHVQIQERGGVSFAAALRSILRQDPDVVFVGEMRDSEVAGIAVKAAMTGHLVLSTLHTNGVVESFIRLIDMGLDTYLMAGTIEMIIAQRLLRRICPHCAKNIPIPDDAVHEFKLSEKQRACTTYKEPQGCQHCMQTGYRGRVAVYEMLRPDEEVRRILRKGGDEQLLVEATKTMVSMRQSGVKRALAGQTTFVEVRRVLGIEV